MGKLTAAKVKTISKPGMHGDGAGLYLRVAAGGSINWIQRITIDGKRRDVGLGGYPTVSLARARELAQANRSAVAEGRDPLAEKRKAKVPTFREAALQTHRMHKPRWRPGRHVDAWLGALERHAHPVIGDLPVDRIGREDVLRVLTPIWTAKPEAARRVRQRVRAVLRWAQAHGFVEHNMAGEVIDGALPSMPAFREHYRALPYAEVADAIETVEASGASMTAKAALRFLILTAARSGEVRGARWHELDMDAREWRIPARRMKTGIEHRVPLGDDALAILDRVRALDDGSGLVFPSPVKPGCPMSDMTLTKVLRTIGLADRATVHGFRSSFRDWCAETGKPRELAEAALAHVVGGVEGAYFRSDLFEQRRRLMADWARFLGGRKAKVVQLHG